MKDSMFTVRRATGDDAEIILALAIGLFSELGHRLPVDDHKSVLLCKTILGNGEYVAFISDNHHGQACGIITLSEGISIYAGGKFGIIREFYVIPEMRSNGVGKALLEKAKEFGRRRGLKRRDSMKNKLMLGLWRYIINVPPFLWQKQIAQGKRKFEKEHGALSDEKRQIHHFVVKELPRNGRPLSPDLISDKIGVPADRVNDALDYLEKRMTFL